MFSVVATILFAASFAHASDRYNYDRYDYDYRSYDNSINHSFNTYDSFNYSYGYPYANYAYAYPSYDYSGSYYDGYNYYGRHGYDEPECSITAYDSNGSYYGGAITLSWWSSDATSAYLSGVGSVSPSGTQTVYDAAGSYTLTVYGPGGTSSCWVSNPRYDSGRYGHNGYNHHSQYGYVSNAAFTYPIYSYPYVSGTVYPTYTNYVTLSQVPYTGFDFGTVGNSLYWLAMMLVAALGAYLIVYSHSGALPRAFVREVAVAARSQVRFVKKSIGL